MAAFRQTYTFRDVYEAARTERNFDYVFWLSIVFTIIGSYVHPILGRFLVCAATFLISTIGLAGFLIVLPIVATPWTWWFNFNIVWGKKRKLGRLLSCSNSNIALV